MSYNLPLLAIPAYYLIALIPHAVATSIASGGSLAKHDNRNPTSTELVTKLKTKLPPKRFAKFERCKSCHRNALENFPLFIVAMLAGLYAERETGQQLHLTFYAGLQLIIRLVYTINYINVETQAWSALRSLSWFAGVIDSTIPVVNAARALGSSS